MGAQAEMRKFDEWCIPTVTRIPMQHQFTYRYTEVQGKPTVTIICSVFGGEFMKTIPFLKEPNKVQEKADVSVIAIYPCLCFLTV